MQNYYDEKKFIDPIGETALENILRRPGNIILDVHVARRLFSSVHVWIVSEPEMR